MSSIRLAWDANPGSELAGYKMHWGTASRTYTFSQDVGAVAVGTVNGLADGVWYFAISAYDNDGNESGFSDEAKITLAPNTTPPAAPRGIHAVDTEGASSVDITNQPQPPPPDVTPPVITNVAVTGLGETVATLTWTTDELADSTVRYATSSPASAGIVVSDATLVTSHSIPLSGLAGSTGYFYEVESGDASSNVVTSAENSFTTLAPPLPSLYDENFDGVAPGSLDSLTSLAEFSTEDPRRGTGSGRIHYPNGVNETQGLFSISSAVSDTKLRMRWYEKFHASFDWPCGLKRFRLLSGSLGPSIDHRFRFHFNDYLFESSPKDHAQEFRTIARQHPVGSYVLTEMFIQLNTIGDANGIWRLWEGDPQVLIFEATDFQFIYSDHVNQGFNGGWFGGNYSDNPGACSQGTSGPTNNLTKRYFDDFKMVIGVDADTMIGPI